MEKKRKKKRNKKVVSIESNSLTWPTVPPDTINPERIAENEKPPKIPRKISRIVIW